MSTSLRIQQAISDQFSVIDFPIYEVDPETCVPSLTGQTEKAKLAVFQLQERFGDKRCVNGGNERTDWRWEVRIKFNNLVCLDDLLEEWAQSPPVVPRPIGSDGSDWQWHIRISSVEHLWRPSQDAGPGTSARISFNVTRT